ncbi:LysM peptidoglycan-binding domain-containing protein [Clostridium sp. SYSU_GA19001]|uniref:LysM peptidoglycan-binding domain-containing protein n=1 Tax=Clostridium caldaquaticum TaxID=2940653 RepID=UPI0020774C90|nr:LysM peptidoglycan-binding domain-containing protein [Clostridium caldaquaticum]MCM8711311.1 LysM peptidoglycan-binding domain-containing protein [Clostridium caldaquaticum]
MITSKKLKVLLFTLSLTLFTAHSAKAASYTVVSGDSLFTISKTFNTTVNSIKADNNLSGDIIKSGQVLNVPAIKYTVKSGDTLYLIAKRYGISLYSLRKANNYWKDYIYVGQTLLIPGVNTTTNAATLTSQTSKGVIPYTKADLDLLARLIHAEAQGQSYKTQVAVGAVVINRVQSSAWPNTIKDVIYQRVNGYYQFTPVLNGWINKPASDTARQAALDALIGIDPTNGAEFYFDDSTKNTWLWSKPVALRVDNMIFSY